MGSQSSGGTGTRRRALLAGIGLSVPLSGCVRRVRNVVDHDGSDQLSLSILTVDADADPASVTLARTIRTAFERAGIDASLELVSGITFYRSVLINHEFDVYVGRHPWSRDPAALYELVHSRYAQEAGWQNPFGFADISVDSRLEEMQEATGEARQEAVAAATEAVMARQPFVPICRPTEFRLVRTDRFDGWERGHPAERSGYIELEPTGTETTLQLGHVDGRTTQNLNPLSVEYRNQGTIMGLVYDSLADEVDGEIRPWLASSWSWDDGSLTVELRPDCSFHDGVPLTAHDVAFTYQFLQDTTRSDDRYPAPTTRLRGISAAVESVDVVSDDELVISTDTSESVIERSLLVPILPRHVWIQRTERASVSGIELGSGTTEALIAANLNPVGSGPYTVADTSEGSQLRLERFDEHFTRRLETDLPEPAVETIQFQIDPSDASAIERIQRDDADMTSLPISSDAVEWLQAAATEETVSVLESPSWSFYHLGFNTRRPPLHDPNFRQTMARLLDKEMLVDTVFDGHAEPIAAPTTDEWTPESLSWDGSDPISPFLGTDGEVETAEVRAAFEAIGFWYGAEDELLVRY